MLRRLGTVRFDRNELAGAFGDIGTDFPLVTGLILVAALDASSVLIMFGAMQIFTGLTYGIPMPAQPLKAMAALVIAQGLSGDLLYGAGLAVGVVMLLLAATNVIELIARLVPKPVIRGIQFGLGLQLSLLALRDYVPGHGYTGYALAGAAFALVVVLTGSRRYPPALFVILLGLVYAIAFRFDASAFAGGLGLGVPEVHLPGLDDVLTGFLVLGLPQIPLSLGNSILATHQLTHDLFPERAVSVRKIGMTYAAMNLINPFLSGIPTCHGSGGIAGHHYFGARTGGSVVFYGAMYVAIGLLAGSAFGEVVELFPLPVLGVILVFEGLVLMRLLRDLFGSPRAVGVALLVGVMAATLPYGYVIGLVVGVVLMRIPWLRLGR